MPLFCLFKGKQFMSKQNGFTLIELIVVITVIGILAVSVAPKLLTKNEFSSVTLRDQLISELRLAQLRAMNDSSACYAVQVSSVDFGIYYTTVTNDICDTSYTLANDKTAIESGTTVAIGTDFSLQIKFDTSGRPSGGNCISGSSCTLTVTAADTVALCIESEGYIHAC